MSDSEADVADALATITAALVSEPDGGVVARLVNDACVALLGASGTGVMVVDPRGGVQLVAASDERSRFVELLQSQIENGPCVDCIRDGVPVAASDLTDEPRWPDFVAAALEVGFRAVHSVPLRLDGQTVGGLNLLYADVTELATGHRRLAQAFADLAALGLVQERRPRRSDLLIEQTLTVLNDRAHLAQAVGMLAGATRLDVEAARAALIAYARPPRRLRDVVTAITSGTLDVADVLAPARAVEH